MLNITQNKTKQTNQPNKKKKKKSLGTDKAMLLMEKQNKPFIYSSLAH